MTNNILTLSCLAGRFTSAWSGVGGRPISFDLPRVSFHEKKYLYLTYPRPKWQWFTCPTALNSWRMIFSHLGKYPPPVSRSPGIIGLVFSRKKILLIWLTHTQSGNDSHVWQLQSFEFLMDNLFAFGQVNISGFDVLQVGNQMVERLAINHQASNTVFVIGNNIGSPFLLSEN